MEETAHMQNCWRYWAPNFLEMDRSHFTSSPYGGFRANLACGRSSCTRLARASKANIPTRYAAKRYLIFTADCPFWCCPTETDSRDVGTIKCCSCKPKKSYCKALVKADLEFNTPHRREIFTWDAEEVGGISPIPICICPGCIWGGMMLFPCKYIDTGPPQFPIWY